MQLYFNNGAADFLGWRNLKSNLPILSSKILETRRFTSPEERQAYAAMSLPAWWDKNFKPTFAVSKSDTKDMLPQSTDLRELGATKILNFVVTASANSSETAIQNAEIESQFFVSGSTYFVLKALLNGYDASVMNETAALQKSISDGKVNLVSMQERYQSLKTLADRYKDQRSGSTTMQTFANANQTIAANAANAKYLPLNTQLVALESDIDQQQLSLKLTEGQLVEIDFLRKFLADAAPILDRDLDGLKSVREMLDIIEQMRSKLSPDDLYALKKADTIRADLTGILMSYTKTLDINIPPRAKRAGLFKMAGWGLMGGLVFCGLALLAVTGYGQLKKRRQTNQAAI